MSQNGLKHILNMFFKSVTKINFLTPPGFPKLLVTTNISGWRQKKVNSKRILKSVYNIAGDPDLQATGEGY